MMPHFAQPMSTTATQRLTRWCLSDAALPLLVGAFEVTVATTIYFVLAGAIG